MGEAHLFGMKSAFVISQKGSGSTQQNNIAAERGGEDNGEGQRRPPPGAADANLCTHSRGGTRPRSQQLAETKAHAAPPFKCRPPGSQQIIEPTEQTSPGKLDFPREERRCFQCTCETQLKCLRELE